MLINFSFYWVLSSSLWSEEFRKGRCIYECDEDVHSKIAVFIFCDVKSYIAAIADAVHYGCGDIHT